MVRRTLQDGTLDALGQQIVSGVFHPGQVLRTEDLGIEHDVSRTVLRETLKVLESMRLIEMRRRVGITVLDRSEWSVFDPRIIRWRMASDDRAAQLKSLTDLRLAVEPVAAYNAASAATSDQRDELIALSSLMLESGIPRDAELHLQRDVAFHCLLLRASANEMFAALSGAIAAVLTGRIRHHLMPDDPTWESLQLHVRAAQSIRDGKARDAESAMRSILSEVKDYLPVAESESPHHDA